MRRRRGGGYEKGESTTAGRRTTWTKQPHPTRERSSKHDSSRLATRSLVSEAGDASPQRTRAHSHTVPASSSSAARTRVGKADGAALGVGQPPVV